MRKPNKKLIVVTTIILLFSGISKVSFAQVNVTHFDWNSTNATSVTITSIIPGGDRDGYLIVINTENSFINRSGMTIPTANAVYSGSGEQVVGNVNSVLPNFTITGLNTSTVYYVSVVAYKTRFGETLPTFGSNHVRTVSPCGLNPSPPSGIDLTSAANQITISSITKGGAEDFVGFVVKMNTTNSFTNPLGIETSLPAANAVYAGSGEQVVYVGTSTAPNISVTNIGGASTPETFYFRVWAYTTQCSTGDYYFRQTGHTGVGNTCGNTAPPDGFNNYLAVGGGTYEPYQLGPLYNTDNTLPSSGVLVYANDVNSFTDPAATLSPEPTANSVYSGSGQQLVMVAPAPGGFATTTGLTPNTTYYFKTYSYYSCGGTMYVNTNDTHQQAYTTCDYSDNLASASVFGTISSNSMELNSFTGLTPEPGVSAPDGYIIRMNNTNSFSSYANGSAIPTGDPVYGGSGEQVIYSGNSTNPNITISGLSASTTYYFNIVAHYPTCGVPAGTRFQQEGYTFAQTNGTASTTSIAFLDVSKTVGDADFDLTASASDGSTVSYQIINSSSSGTSLSGANNETVTLGKAGTVIIEASANGASKQATLTINAPASASAFTFNDKFVDSTTPSPTNLSAFTSGATGAVTYEIIGTDYGYSISGSDLTWGAASAEFVIRATDTGTGESIDAIYHVWDGVNNSPDIVILETSYDPDLAINSTTTIASARVFKDDFGVISNLSYNVFTSPVAPGFASIQNSTDLKASSYIATLTLQVTATESFTFYENGTATLNQTYYVKGDQVVTFDGGSNSISSTYGDAPFNLVASSTTGNLTFISQDPSIISISGSTATINAPGYVEIIASDGGNSSYFPASQSLFFTVNKASTSIVATATQEYPFSGGPIDFVASATGLNSESLPLDIVYRANGTSDLFTSTVPTVAGIYDVEARLAESALVNYADPGVTSGTLEILDRTLITASDVVITPPASLTYDATEKTYTVTPASLTPPLPQADLELTYVGRNGTTYASSATAPTEAGDYTVTVSVKVSNPDYSGTVSEDFTIVHAATSITLNLPGSALTYNAAAQGIAPEANDVGGNPTLTLVTEYSVSGAGSYSTTAPTDAGTYDVRVNLDASENNYTATEATGSYTIDPAAQVITFNAIPEVACGQTTIDLSLYASVDSGQPITFTSGNLAVATITGNTLTIVGGGTSLITATQAGDANHNAAVSKDQTLMVAASQINFTVDAPANVLICDGSAYTLPALTSGDYFSAPGGTGTAYSAGQTISSTMTMYVYGVSSENASCTDENSFEIAINNIPIDALADADYMGSYTLPALTNGTYYTASGGTGSMLSAGDAITSSQTIYIYTTDGASGCTRETSFAVTITPNSALHFDQAGSLSAYDYLSVPDDNTLDFATSFTFEAWVNFDQLTLAGAGLDWRALFSKSRYADSYGLMIYAGDKRVRFYHAGFGAGYTDYMWTSLSPGAWHHIAVKVDAGNSRSYVLIDGVEVSSAFGTGTLTTNAEPLQIGASRALSGDPYPFDGMMDEVRLWNTARTNAEILAAKDIELTGSESGLVLYYDFSEGTPNGTNTALTQVTDRSGNGNHASFNNFALTGSQSNYVDGPSLLNQIPQAITFDALSNVTFGDADFNLAATSSSGLAVSYSSSNTSVATISGNTVTILGAGTTSITASQAGDATYSAAPNVSQSLTVDTFSTSISLNLPGTNPIYSGVGQGITPTADDKDGNPTLTLVTEYSVSGANTFSTTLPVNAGTYDVRVNLDASETNYGATQATGSFTIDKAPLTARLNNASIPYGVIGRNNHPATYTGFVNGETESVLSITTGSPTVLFLDIPGGGINYNVGGPYAGGITWASANPETLITSNNYTITFNPGDITSVTARPINITGDNRTITYGADANTGNTVSFEAYDEAGERGLANGESAADFTGTVTFANITATDAGSHTGVITPNGGLTNGNYNINYVSGDLTINKAQLTVKAQAISRAYAAANPTVSVFEYTGFTVAGDGTDGATDISGLAGLTGSASGTIAAAATAIANAGTTHAITVNVSGLSSTNYTFAADDTGLLTINAKGITVTADAGQTKVYGAADPESFTYTPSPALESGDSFTGDLTRVAGENVGTYAINQGTLDAGSNYAITYVSNDFEIAQKALTVTADNRTITYGDDANTGNTVSYAGFITGENETNLGGTLSFATISQTNVGTYNGVITPSGLTSTNYAINFVSGNLTIDQKALTVTADNRTITYGDDANTGNTVSYAGFIAGENDTNLGGALSFASISQTDVGSYTGVITPLGLTSGNYAISFVSGDLTIGQKALTVTADNRTITYGDDANVGNTVSYSGFITGENDTNLGGTLGFANISQTNVGTYNGAIIPSGLTSSNYAISFENGDLTIANRIITVTADAKTKTYADADPPLTYQITSGMLQGADVLNGSLTRVAGENAGTYAILQGTLDNSNYTINFVSNDLTIEARALTVTADAKSKIYGDADPAFTYQVTNGALQGMDAITGNLNRTAGESVGTYSIQQGTLTAGGNYDLTYVPADLTINQKSIVVAANVQSKVYGDADPVLTYGHAPLAFSDTFTGSLERVAGETPGTYAINQGTLALNGNYQLTFFSASLNIIVRSITVTADPQSKTYGEVDPAFTYQVTSGALQGSDVLSGALSRAAGEDVGTYAIQLGTLDNSNYDITFISDDLTIGTRALTVTAEAKSKTYGDVDPAFTYQITTGALQGMDAISGTQTRVAGENVGNYAINQGTLTAGGNYDLTYVPADLTIGIRAITVTADVKSKVYGDADPTLTIQITSGSLRSGDGLGGALSRVPGEGVGTYAINQGTLTAGANYNLSFIGNDLTINPKNVVVSANDLSKVYGDADPTLTYVEVGSFTLLPGDSFTGSLTRDPGENAGTYTINQGTLDAGPNYALAFGSGTFEITPRDLTIAADDKTKIVGQSDPALTYQITNGALQFSDAVSGGLTRDAGETIGGYNITQGSLVVGPNYNLTFVPGTFTIADKIVQTITFNSLSPVLYGSAAFDLSATGGTSGNPVTFVSSDLSVATISGNTVTIVGAGTTTITASQAGNATHAPAANVNQSLLVVRPSLSVNVDAGQSKVYGDTDPSFTYKILTGNLVNGDVLTGELSRAAGENAGTYVINQGTLDNPNYNIIFGENDFTITPKALTVTADAGQTKVYGSTDPASYTYTLTAGTLETGDSFTGAQGRAVGENVGTYAINQGTLTAGSNYTISYVSNDFAITQKALTVTADAKSKTYGDADPSLTHQVTSGTLESGDVISGALTRTAGENVGTYAINQGSLTAGSNYNLTYVSADLTIDPRGIGVIAEVKSKVYGDSDPILTYGVFSGSLVNGDVLSGAIMREAGEDVGSYAIGRGTLDHPNYTISYTQDFLTISKRAITVTADASQSKVYGATDPAFTHQVTSGSLQFSDALTGNLARTSGENVGTYAINQGTLDAGANYSITYVSNDFTITQKALTVTADAGQTKVYGSADPSSYSYTLTAGTLESGDSFTGAQGRAAGENVGTYAINQGTLTAGANYTIMYVSNDFAITQKALTVTADAGQTKVYGSADPASYSYTLTTGTLEIGDSFTGALSRAAGEHAGTYAINQGTLTAGSNYSITYTGDNYSITQKALTATADNKTKVYGSVNPTLTISYTGFVSGEDVSVITEPSISTNATASSSAGTYSITLIGGGSTNYALTLVDGTLTINKADQTITFNALNDVTVGSADFNLAGTASSGLTVTYSSSNTAVATVSGNIVTIFGVGSTNITASQAGDGNYNAAEDVVQTLTVNNKLSQTITFNALSAKNYGDANFELTATGGGSGNVVTYVSSNTTVATVSGTTVTIVGAGSTDITASQTGDAAYNSATDVVQTLTVNKATLSITADDQSKSYGTANPTLTITYSGFVNGENEGTITPPVIATAANMSSNAGTYPITLTGGSGGNNYSLITNDGTLTVTQATLTATADNQAKNYGAANPGLTFQYAGFVNGEDASVIDTAPSASTSADATSNVGSYDINVAGGSDNNYTFNYVKGTLTISRATLTATADNKTRVFGATNPTLTISYSGFVNGEDAGIIDVVPTAATTADASSSVGFYPITVAGGSDNNYDFSYVSGTLTVSTADQTITFNALSTKTFGDPAFDLSATASSGIAVSYISSNTAVATISGSTVTITGAGITTITAQQAGDQNYNAATAVAQTLTVDKAEQTITFNALADVDVNTGTVSLSATASSSLAVSYSVVSGPASVAGSVLTLTGTGTVEVLASQSGDANYNPATSVTQSFNVTDAAKQDQTITFDALSAATFGDPAFDLIASASSGLVINFNSSDPTVVTINGSTVTIVGAGTTTITATQAGDASFNPAPVVSQTLTVNKAEQTISFDALSTKIFGDSAFELTASVSSALTVDYTSSNVSVATINGNTVTIIGAGTTIITAEQTGNQNYNAATAVSQTLTVDKAAQTITFTTIGDRTLQDSPITLQASASSSLTVQFTLLEGDGVISGDQLTVNAAGNFRVEASQVGNNNYLSAQAIEKSFAVTDPSKTDQTITFDAITDKTYGDVFNLNGSASSGLALIFSIVSGSATISGDQVTITDVGAVTIRANQPGDGSFNAAPEVIQSFNVNKTSLTVTADNQTIKEGDPIPNLTFTYAGFVNGEDQSVIDTPPAISTTATSTSTSGSYPIELTGGTDNHYSFNLVNGSLTIEVVTSLTNELLKEVVMYPMPFDHEFTIELPEKTAGSYQLRISNIDGRQVFETELNGSQLNHRVMGLKSIPEGIYIIQLKLDNAVRSYRVMKK